MRAIPGYLYLNGRIVAAPRAKLSPWDRGWLFGQGLFETLRTCRGRPLLLAEHLERLKCSAQLLRLAVPPDCSEAVASRAVAALLRRNGLREAYVRIMLTAGAAEDSGRARSTLCILTREFHPYPQKLYRWGADVIVSSIRRNPSCPLARHKTLNYWANLIARREATESGATEAILLDTRGYVAEGSCTNLFFVRKGHLCTPSLKANILPGITRRCVMDLVRAEGSSVSEGMYRLAAARRADEAFITNSLVGLMPVRKIEGQRIGRRCPGPLTRRLMKLYGALS